MIIFFEILFACGVGAWFYHYKKKVKKAKEELIELNVLRIDQESKRDVAKLSEAEMREALKNLNQNYDELQEQITYEKGVLNATKESNIEKLKILEQEQEEKKKELLEQKRLECKVDIDKITEDLKAIKQTLKEERAKVKAVSDSRKLAEKNEADRDFHRVCVPIANLNDISRLREITSELNNPDILYKLIWKTFYMSETSDMINRVVGSEKISGIYKITYIPTGKCYIGRSVDIAERFKQHIRCALKASKGSAPLYDKMFELGVENFTFEILQKAAPEELSELEAYWIDFYDSVNSGFNELSGSR